MAKIFEGRELEKDEQKSSIKLPKRSNNTHLILLNYNASTKIHRNCDIPERAVSLIKRLGGYDIQCFNFTSIYFKIDINAFKNFQEVNMRFFFLFLILETLFGGKIFYTLNDIRDTQGDANSSFAVRGRFNDTLNKDFKNKYL